MATPNLRAYGQSLWLDAMERRLLTSGDLQRFIQHDGVRGVTSNPSIFERAIGGSQDYDEQLRVLQRQRDLSASDLYEALATRDIQDAADLLRPVYEESDRLDGYACLEVSPRVAHDTQATVQEARRLWQRLGRPNVMIKVPATAAGIAAIEQLLSEGININVTLMFGHETYGHVAQAYIAGLREFAARGGMLSGLASVASIFVSRLDVLLDPMLEHAADAGPPADRPRVLALRGELGIANAKRIYRAFRAVCEGAAFAELARQGARPQRILFASTSIKDPTRSDVAYVEALVGPDTVDTVPLDTLAAFRDHGHARETLTRDLFGAEEALIALETCGISLSAVTRRLLDEGVQKFAAAHEALLTTLEARRPKLHRA